MNVACRVDSHLARTGTAGERRAAIAMSVRRLFGGGVKTNKAPLMLCRSRKALGNGSSINGQVERWILTTAWNDCSDDSNALD